MKRRLTALSLAALLLTASCATGKPQWDKYYAHNDTLLDHVGIQDMTPKQNKSVLKTLVWGMMTFIVLTISTKH